MRRLRVLGDRLHELELDHLQQAGGRQALAAIAAVSCAAVVGVFTVALPLDVAAYRWWLIPGVPIYIAALAGAWLVLRRLNVRHGKVASEYRAIRRERDDVIDATIAQAVERRVGGDVQLTWAAVDDVHAAMVQDIERTRVTPEDLPRAYRSALRSLPVVVPVGMLTVLAFFGVVVMPIATGESRSIVVAGVPLVCGWAMVVWAFFRRSGEERQQSRTLITTRRHELSLLRQRLVESGVEPWRFPATYAQRAWMWTRRGSQSPADKLRLLPANASALRRVYWRYVGPGVVRIAGVVIAAIVVAGLLRGLR